MFDAKNRFLSKTCLTLVLAQFAPSVFSMTPVEGAGCPQLQLLVEAPEVVVDDRLFLKADQVLLESEGLSKLAGGVSLRQGDQVFSTESLSFNKNERIVSIDGDSLFRNSNLVIKSAQAQLDLNSQSGFFEDAQFTLPGRAARGRSDRIDLNAKTQARLQGASYTTCSENSNAWYLLASSIRLDHESGLGSARNARLKFMGVPVLYLPYFQFPIDDKRRSGLLYPTIGQLSGSGVDVRWPVYLNLAENYDATFTPRFLSDRGLQPGIEFRYLLDQHIGRAQYEYLDDRKFGQDRSLFTLDHRGLINERMSVQATYGETSDRNYFEDLGGSISSASLTHLEQSARVVYQAPAAYTLSAMVQNFQPIASNLTDVDDPYKRLPQIRLDALTRNQFLHTRAGISSEFVNFARGNSIEGARLMMAPYLRFERDRANWYFESQADLHYTRYELSGEGSQNSDTRSRSLPILSAETGLRFERITRSGRLQTLTPRGIALFVPFENQDDIPLFDTGEPDFDFVQLFARNRFSGEDRISDARHLAGEVTWREIDQNTGLSRWSATAGQLYRIEAPRVSIDGVSIPQRGATEFVGQFTYRILSNWRSVMAGQWSPEDNQLERSQIGVRYVGPGSDRRLNLSYRYRRDLIEQADVSFSSPVYGPWKLAGRTRFSLRDNKSRENFIGVEYSTCCWAVRTSWRRYIGDVSGEFDSGIYVQLQLKGLANIGAGGESLLPDEEIDNEMR